MCKIVVEMWYIATMIYIKLQIIALTLEGTCCLKPLLALVGGGTTHCAMTTPTVETLSGKGDLGFLSTDKSVVFPRPWRPTAISFIWL